MTAGVVVGGGEELAVDERRPVGRAFQPGELALEVAEQGVDGRPWRHQPFGRTEEHGDVDIEAGRTGERADVDAVADLAAPTRGDVELGDERGVELGAGRRPADRVEVVEAVEHLGGLLPALALGTVEAVEPTATEPPLELLLGPGDPRRPPARHGRVAERRTQVGDEGEQLQRGVGLGVDLIGVADEVRVPVLLAHDAGGPPDPFPAGGRHDAPVRTSGRHVAEQRHQGAAAQAAAIELEQLGQHARHHALADAGARPAVPGDAGGGELVLDEAGVGPVGGEQHGDAVEAGAGPGGGEDGAHADAHLVVGVGGGDDGHFAGRRRWGVERRVQRSACQRLGEGDDTSVGVGVAGECDDQLDAAPLAQRGQELRFQRAQPLGQVDDDAPEALGDVVAGSLGGPGEEVALVVPLRGEQRGPPRRRRRAGSRPRAVAASAVSDPGPAARSSRYRSRRATTVDGWWLTAAYSAGGVMDHPLDGEVDHRCGDGLASLAVQGRGAEQFGEPEHREDVDRRGAATPPEGPPGHHAGRVRRHDDGDGSQRIVTLGSGDR